MPSATTGTELVLAPAFQNTLEIHMRAVSRNALQTLNVLVTKLVVETNVMTRVLEYVALMLSVEWSIMYQIVLVLMDTKVTHSLLVDCHRLHRPNQPRLLRFKILVNLLHVDLMQSAGT